VKDIEEEEDHGKNEQMVEAQEETEWEAQAESLEPKPMTMIHLHRRSIGDWRKRLYSLYSDFTIIERSKTTRILQSSNRWESR